MEKSPLNINADLVSFALKINGKQVDDRYAVSRIFVSKGVNQIPLAEITLIEVSGDREGFLRRASVEFAPGDEIEILAGYRQKNRLIFKGIILKHAIKVQANEATLLEVTCLDKSVKMTLGRKNACFQHQRDSDVISYLAGEAGLESEVEETSRIHEELVQYYASDWDYMVMRAEVNGHLVIPNDGKINVGPPAVTSVPALVVTYGKDLLEIEAALDAKSQLGAVNTHSWDMKTRQFITGTSNEPEPIKQGNLDGKTLSKVIGVDTFVLQTSAPLPRESLDTWASAQLLKSRLARIQGRVLFQGNAFALPGKMITLAGLSDRFNGNAFISAVKHTIEDGNWTTEVNIGLASPWYVETQKNIVSPLNAGLLPGITGLHVGVVKKTSADPAGEMRVQVDIPANGKAGEGIWARLGMPYATDGAGVFFMPEIGDEVVLGFLNDDPRFPVILGSLYSSENRSPILPDDQNSMKAVVTKSKLKLLFDDEQKLVQLETPGGQVVSLNDKTKSITLTDQSKNRIEMTPEGIVLESNKNLSLKAKGEIVLDAGAGITQTAKEDLNIEGVNINATAQMSLTAEGSASATLKAAGNVTVQGAMVMIN